MAVAGAVALATGCAVGPTPKAPEIDMPGAYVSGSFHEGGQATQEPWWRGFDDPGLNGVIETVLDRNLDIETALAALAEAGALEDAFRSDLFPVIDGVAEAGYRRALFGDEQGSDDLSGRAGGAFEYTADLAGGDRRALQAAAARLRAASYNVGDARRLAVRAAALQYIEMRRAGARMALLETSFELQARTREIVSARFEAGLSPQLDVDRAQSDLARTRADRGVIAADRQDAAFALSILAGQRPGALSLGPPAESVIPDFARRPGVGVPADLLRNRPDIRRAESQLIAEIAGIGVEKADLFPTLRLPGSITAGSADILTPGLGQATLAVNALIDVPLFDFGRRRAEVWAQRARADAALIAWRSAVLNALGDTESALVRIEALRQRLDSLEAAVSASQSAYNQLDALYREGLAGFIDVLDSQRSLIASREAVVETRADLASEIVRLYAAVGLMAPEPGPASQSD